MSMSSPFDAEFDSADEILIPAVWDVIAPAVELAREYGPLPRLRSAEFLAAPDTVKMAVLALIGSHRCFGDPALRLLREVSDDIHGGDREPWRQVTLAHIPYDELKRRRAVPGPLAGDVERGAAS